MMRRMLVLLVLLVASVTAAIWFERQGGFVMIRIGEVTVQSSLFVAVAGVVVLWLAASVVTGLIRRLGRVPERVRGRLGSRRRRRAVNALLEGVIELAEGHYAVAEKRLERSVEAARLPVFNHLLAAIAAQRRGDWARRDDLLTAADAAEPRARVAVGVLQAQLQVEAGQWEQALATLSRLRREAPRNHRVLSMLVQTLRALDDREGLEDLLPDLRRERVLSESEMAALEAEVLAQRFRALGEEATPDGLARVWKTLPRERQRDPALRARYARALLAAGHQTAAERLLRRWLHERWSDPLVEVYGELALEPPQRALNQLAEWLRQRPEDATLLFAAGRQAMRAELWGQARSYLEAAAARSDAPDIHRHLAELYEQLGEAEKARAAYRVALGLPAEPPALPGPDTPAEPATPSAR